MKRKFLQRMCLLAVVTALLCSALSIWVMNGTLYNSVRTEVRKELSYLASAVERDGEIALTQAGSDHGNSHITWIDSDNTVLYDNKALPAQTEDFLSRPEVQDALTTGYGEFAYRSETIGKKTLSAAARLGDGTVLQISIAVDSIFGSMISCLPLMVVAMLIVLFFAILLVRGQSNHLVRAVKDLNLAHPLSNDTYEELSPLLLRLEKQDHQIEAAAAALQKQQEEFSAITAHMREGLIMLGKTALVLSVNPSALHVLRLPDGEYVGKHIFALSRNLEMQAAVETSLAGVPCEKYLHENGRVFQLMATPVREDGDIQGAILLFLDITEKQAAEKMRREFSANVSHELKTPLTSISGYAEIIQNGLVQKEDLPRFAGRIYHEAQRLISLVEDIIRLSRLDEEGGEVPRESVDLLSLAKETADRLSAQAQRAQVDLSVTGDAVNILGIRQVLSEMLYNLLENAIKYNRPGGRVTCSILSTPKHITVSVSDTGIGIPAAHQKRVFERFYRVDKSHSKETGGTGLGLSIVKHGAMCHNAKINLESTEGVGTTITIIFEPGGTIE
jgi:two-component system phosphate regulon sensor histidine kinase PhoR